MHFGFRGFQYQAPKTTLAPIVSEEYQPSVAIRPSINTNCKESKYWLEINHGTPRGMQMGSVSRYPYSKRVNAPPCSSASLQMEDTNAAIQNVPITETSISSVVQQSSDTSVQSSLHSLSNFMSSSEVQTTTTDMPRSTQRVSRPWFRSYTPGKDNNAKTGHVFKGFKPAPTQPPSPQIESLNNVQPSSGFPSNNDVHVSSTTREAKPGPISTQPIRAKVVIHLTKLLMITLVMKTPSLPHMTQKATKCQAIPLGTNLVNSQKSGMAMLSWASKNVWAKQGQPRTKKDANLCAQNVPLTTTTPTPSKVPPVSGSIEASEEHPPPVTPTSASSVHPSPPSVQIEPDPSTTELAESHNPTSSVVKGKRVKGKGQNRIFSSDASSPSNDTASPPIIRPPQEEVPFSGVRPRGGSRPSVKPTSNTTASGQDGGALDKDQPTPRGSGSPQGKGGDPKAVPLPPFPSEADTAQSGEVDVSSVKGDVQSEVGVFISVERGMISEENVPLDGSDVPSAVY
ncbi:unnamed protein product [Coregonus sp. 'balchen']|nr:unnamed protein product [Coregonus sp. 'balchen']